MAACAGDINWHCRNILLQQGEPENENMVVDVNTG